MLKDFERLYLWKERRFLRSPRFVLVVLPKELDISSMKAFWNDHQRMKFANDFVRYVEWFGGRKATPEDEIEVIDPDDSSALQEATRRWLVNRIDTKKIGLKEFVPIEETIRENEERLKREKNL